MSFDWILGMALHYWIAYDRALQRSIHQSRKQDREYWAVITAILQMPPNHLTSVYLRDDQQWLLTTKRRMILYKSNRKAAETGSKIKRGPTVTQIADRCRKVLHRCWHRDHQYFFHGPSYCEVEFEPQTCRSCSFQRAHWICKPFYNFQWRCDRPR